MTMFIIALSQATITSAKFTTLHGAAVFINNVAAIALYNPTACSARMHLITTS
ncbi:hypothetical protein [Vibrio phage vB_VpaS_CHI]|nr:hypothetical protein [Vibrio phage vB_VpaS_ALK]USL90094.1 hypothetical protein [Vibrio phage vB_VpaS_CHI]